MNRIFSSWTSRGCSVVAHGTLKMETIKDDDGREMIGRLRLDWSVEQLTWMQCFFIADNEWPAGRKPPSAYMDLGPGQNN